MKILIIAIILLTFSYLINDYFNSIDRVQIILDTFSIQSPCVCISKIKILVVAVLKS